MALRLLEDKCEDCGSFQMIVVVCRSAVLGVFQIHCCGLLREVVPWYSVVWHLICLQCLEGCWLG